MESDKWFSVCAVALLIVVGVFAVFNNWTDYLAERNKKDSETIVEVLIVDKCAGDESPKVCAREIKEALED